MNCSLCASLAKHDNHPSEIAVIRRSAYLVSYDRQILARLSGFENCIGKATAIRAKEPRGSDNASLRHCVTHEFLPLRFRSSIHVQGTKLLIDSVRNGFESARGEIRA